MLFRSVISSNENFSAVGAVVARDVDQAMALAGDVPEVCVIGGAEVFKAFLPVAQKIYLTRILASVVGDVMIPPIDLSVWSEMSRSEKQQAGGDSAAYEILVYERR